MKRFPLLFSDKSWQKIILALFIPVFSVLSIQAKELPSVFDLMCESEETPLGVDTPSPVLGWKIQSHCRGVFQKAYQIQVALSESDLLKENSLLWDTHKQKKSQSIEIVYRGKPLKSFTTYYWRVRIWDTENQRSLWSRPACFTTGAFALSDWKEAQWIALEADDPDLIYTEGLHGGWGAPLDGKAMAYNKLPQFRKEFSLRAPLKKAYIAICGLGQFDLFLNGEKVGDHFMDPAWTKYDKSQQYLLFDVTQELRKADTHAIGVMLGNGFYNIPRDRYLKFCASYGYPKMIAQIRLEYEDGSRQIIGSDSTWRTTASPITFSSIYGGEDYDATLEEGDWKQPGFDDRSWQPALVAANNVPLMAQRGTPVRIIERLPAERYFQAQNGAWIYDMGQNFSGIPTLTLRSQSSKTVRMEPVELLFENGNPDPLSAGSPVYFQYTTKGSGAEEQWHPQFTYFGFRYVAVTGAVPQGEENPQGLPEIITLEGLHTTSATRRVGSFSCSSSLFNRIYTLIDWSIRNNMASSFTDCPHREKLGWIEQSHLMFPSVAYAYHILRSFTKNVEDMRQSQHANGLITAISPEYVPFDADFVDTPEWGCAYILTPWYLYRWYGDLRPLQVHYEGMVRYIDYLERKADGHILSHGLGDWCDVGDQPPGYSQQTLYGITGTAFYYAEVSTLARIAYLLGKEDEALRFQTLASEIKSAFNTRFFNSEKGYYGNNSQTSNAMALAMELVPSGEEDRVFQNLLQNIEAHGEALTCGEIGHRFLLQELSRRGAGDLLYRIYHRYDVPGYGYQLARGATALTESWQALRTLSNDHCMMGHLYEWFYNQLGGIGQTENSVAFREIIINPQIIGEITWAKASTESPYGVIRSEWEKSGNRYTHLVEVPVGCQAFVILPANSFEQISESGRNLTDCPHIELVEVADGKARVKIGSGCYRFQVENQ